MNVEHAIQLAYSNLQKGKVQEAEDLFKKILKKQPHNSDALHFLGIISYQSNNYDAAAGYFKKAILHDSTDSIKFFAYSILGDIAQKRGQFEDALSYYEQALKINPDSAEIYFHLGNISREKKQNNEALVYYQKALHVNPNLTDAYHELVSLSKEMGTLDEVIVQYSRELAIRPDFANAHYQLGKILNYQGRKEEAFSAYERALKCNPGFYLKVLWGKCFTHLPILYTEQSHIGISRKRYEEALTALRDEVFAAPPREILALAEEVGDQQPFFLAYQGLNDRELQQRYGDTVCRIMALRYPQYAGRIDKPTLKDNEQLRVGIISGYFYVHSVWKLFKGWVENLDKQRFSLYGYHTGRNKDHETVAARQLFHCFTEDTYNLEDLCKIIREHNLHIILYPEIGMDPLAGKLATLCLAPVQCTSWGHPDTSGLPTIDYFLSSERMEPPDADSHYTEKLVRLPNLSVYYEPWEISGGAATRDTFGLRHDAILYLCCQSLFKYLPQYDEVYPRIAQKIKNCQFIFIGHSTIAVTEQFCKRLDRAFSNVNLNAEDYLVILPRLNPEQYAAINGFSDIYLDSIGWSGGNTTLEAITWNLPIITLPGELMRGRHSAAILAMMELTDTIAQNVNDYIDLAVRLGKDGEWRKQISEKIAIKKHLVYRDKSCITALEDFLVSAFKDKLD